MTSSATITQETPVETAVRGIAPGTLLAGRYRVVRQLGKGGYGEVLAAEDNQTRRKVAIKILHATVQQSDPAALARMRQEAEILRSIDHVNVVRLLSLETAPQGEFMVLELVQGRSLHEVMCEDELPSTERVIEVVRQLLMALEAAHRKQILHRDIKPENIMLCALDNASGGEQVKLLDFGIAKAQGSLHGDEDGGGVTLVKTLAGGFVGTPHYASPEQAVGDPLGPAADLFSLGLVICEWLTGTPRLNGDRPGEVLAHLVHPKPFDVSDAPPEWRPWLLRILEKDSARRFARAEEALRALDDVAALTPSSSATVEVAIPAFAQLEGGAPTQEMSFDTTVQVANPFLEDSAPTMAHRVADLASGPMAPGTASLELDLDHEALQMTRARSAAARSEPSPGFVPSRSEVSRAPGGASFPASQHADRPIHAEGQHRPRRPEGGMPLMWLIAVGVGSGVVVFFLLMLARHWM